ncbi:MAG: hypothetical protein ACKO19_07105, partial [Betaproteobacteria bacterium]
DGAIASSHRISVRIERFDAERSLSAPRRCMRTVIAQRRSHAVMGRKAWPALSDSGSPIAFLNAPLCN